MFACTCTYMCMNMCGGRGSVYEHNHAPCVQRLFIQAHLPRDVPRSAQPFQLHNCAVSMAGTNYFHLRSLLQQQPMMLCLHFTGHSNLVPNQLADRFVVGVSVSKAYIVTSGFASSEYLLLTAVLVIMP